MRRIILLTAMLMSSVLIPFTLSPPLARRTAAGGHALAAVAPLQAPSPRPIRTLPGLEEIRVWLGAGRDFRFGPSQTALRVRLDALDHSSFDMKPSEIPGGLDAYDIFYSNADGTLNVDGAYLTIEAVSNARGQEGGGGNVAEVGLKFSSSTSFEYGNAVASFLALGNNANPDLNSNAIDGNTQTSTRLGNTVGQTQRLRITIGFLSSSGEVTCRFSIFPGDLVVSDLGGRFNERVTVPDGCDWTAISTQSWARITSGSSGAGSGTVSLEIDPNPDSIPRRANVHIANRTLTVVQHAPLTCPYRLRLSATSAAFPSGGGTHVLLVYGGTDFRDEDCRWSATSDVGWIQVGPRQVGVDPAFLPYLVLPNAGPPRTGRILIGRETYVVRQGGRGVTTCSTQTPLTIADGQTVTSTLTFGDDLFFEHINLRLNIEHDNTADLEASLTTPDNQTIELFSQVGGDGDNFGSTCSPLPDCIFTDYSTRDIRQASPPLTGYFYSSLSREIERKNLRGTWTLTITDRSPGGSGGSGKLNCWCLEVEPLQDGCVLTPEAARVPVFTPHTVTATVSSNMTPAQGVPVNFVVHGERGELRLNAQIPTNARGEAVLTYIDSEAGTHDIEARASVGGVTSTGFAQATWVPNGRCAIETVEAAASPHSKATLSVLRQFRDKGLARTPRGQRYAQLYYQFSPEAVQILMFNPMLMLRSREIIERYKPVIESMAEGEPVTLTRGDLDEIDDFLNRFVDRGSPRLRQAIKAVREDLADPQLHQDFQITVIDGPKRELPSSQPLRQISRAGGAALFAGLLVAFAHCFIRARTPDSKAGRLLCLTLAGFIAQPANVLLACPAVSGTLKRERPRSPIGVSTSRGKVSVPTDDAFGKLPLRFEVNQGQMDSSVSFMSRGDEYSLFLTPTEATIRLRVGAQSQSGADRPAARNAQSESPGAFVEMLNSKSAPGARPSLNRQAAVVRMRLIGANPAARLAGLDELPGRTSYFMGKESARWRAGVPAYARVECKQVYPGIDMVYYGNGRELEYDFQLAPGADYRAVKLIFDGAERIEIDPVGDLAMSAGGGVIRQRKPVVYQETNGVRRFIPARYVMSEGDAPTCNPLVGFEIGAYDPTRPLTIDPALAYSTYLGGSNDDEGNSIAVDSAGNLYVVGFTDSIDFPTAGASQPAPAGGQQDLFVAKLNPAGTQLVYSTYLGGDGQDNGSGIAVDAAGNAYITGFTGSTNFPVRNALQSARNGPVNAFVAKLGPTGDLLYSTHLGGSTGDYGSSIAVDSAGDIYLAGVTTSPNFPLAGALQQQPGGSADVYVARLNAAGRRLVYSTYLGGAGNDGATGIAVDAAGSVYVTGLTASRDFRTASPLQAAHGGGLFDAFVARLNPAGQLIYSTYLGGSGEDRGFRIAMDSAGNACVTGDTDSSNFPVKGALQKQIGGSVDAFVTKLNPSGTRLVYSTYLGGSLIDGGTAVVIDSAGSAYVAGFTASTRFPTASPLQPSHGGGSFDGFVAKLNPSGEALDYSSYLGGSDIDAAFGVAVDASGNAYVMGQTTSLNFPTSAPLQPTYGGGASDVFVTKITFASAPHIDGAQVNGKKLLVSGSGFDQGAKILLNGEQQKTRNDDPHSSTSLIGKKAGRQIAPGQTVSLQVRNADGALSNEFSFTRAAP